MAGAKIVARSFEKMTSSESVRKGWVRRKERFGPSGGNAGKHQHLTDYKRSPAGRIQNSLSAKRWWSQNKNTPMGQSALTPLKQGQRNHFWDDKQKAVERLRQYKVKHDEVLDRRIEELKARGAQILTTDYALKIKRRTIPDVLYYLNGEIIGEDVKHTGLIEVENRWSIK